VEIDDGGPRSSTRGMEEAHRTEIVQPLVGRLTVAGLHSSHPEQGGVRSHRDTSAVEVSGYAKSSEQAHQIILSDAVSLLTHSAWPAVRPSPASLAHNPEIHYHVQFTAIFIQ
jgi:hypothetical protein